MFTARVAGAVTPGPRSRTRGCALRVLTSLDRWTRTLHLSQHLLRVMRSCSRIPPAPVPVFLALQARQIAPRALVLLEPGLYDVARGVPVIEDHIGTMTRARALSRSSDLFGYWSIVRPLMFGGPADRSRWYEEREAAARFEAKQPPWGFGVTSSAINGVPTLVVTGGWNSENNRFRSARALWS